MLPPRPSPVVPWGLWERSLGMVAGVCLTGLRGAHRPPTPTGVVHEERWHRLHKRVPGDGVSRRSGHGAKQPVTHPRVLIHTPPWVMAYFELNARRWQARVGRGVPPPVFVIHMFLAYFKLNARRWQARVPRGGWMPLRWAQPPSDTVRG